MTSSSEEVFVFDLTIDDMNDIPVNQTSASDVLNLTYELGKSPRVTNLTEIGYSMNGQPLLLVEFGDYDADVPTVYFVAAQHGNEPASLILHIYWPDTLLEQLKKSIPF